MKLYPDPDPESFKGSAGWLRKFNLRHGIKNVAYEVKVCSLMFLQFSQDELQNLIDNKGLTQDQIFNADETGLWWRLTPCSSLNSGGKHAANLKKAKDRVTILGCANAGTHRLPLMLINKVRNQGASSIWI